MCSLTFLPRKNGCLVAMNRDEKLQRVRASVPRIHPAADGPACYPTEPGGGTWIGFNEHGIIAALLNWYRHPSRPEAPTRGTVVPRLLLNGPRPDWSVIDDVDRLNPFRAILVSTDLGRIEMATWDGRDFRTRRLPWRKRHLFSCGVEESRAERVRAATCRLASAWPAVGTRAWVRRLHASHLPARGPFSLCAHRSDAGTVSYSEITADKRRITFRYVEGPPCCKGPTSSVAMERK